MMGAWVIGAIIYLLGIAAIIYVAYHFISKFW